MLESISSNNIFEYKKLTEEEQRKRGILGRLVGVIADTINPTRNGRKYSAELWEKVFENPIMQEKIKNRVCFGEACHPIDGREEVDPEKVAICLAEVPKKNDKGQLVGVFDVLDTPCGRILKTMLDYGANIGVSSRGSGDVVPDYDGNEAVDPDTYDCICWDAVFIPAVKEARLKLVNESLGGKTLKQALTESLNNASEKDRKVMQETIDAINNSLTEDANSIKSAMNTLHDYLMKWYDENIAPEKAVDAIKAGWDSEVNSAWLTLANLVTNIKNECTNSNNEAIEDLPVDNDKGMIDELQSTLTENNKLSNTITKLQEKLSVSYAKGDELQEKCDKYLRIIKKLSEDNRKIIPLSKKVKMLDEKLKSNDLNLDDSKNKLIQTRKSALESKTENYKLNKLLEDKNKQIDTLNNIIESLKVDSLNDRNAYEAKLENVKNNFNIKIDKYEDKLHKTSKLIEHYKSIADRSVEKYIESQARILGVSKQEIKNKLSENYSFKDIDKACESLKEYKLNVSKLPFTTSNNLNEDVIIKATPRKESIIPADVFCDEVDDQLISLAGLS